MALTRRPELAELQRDEVLATVGELLRRRVHALPVAFLVVLLVWRFDPVLWRRAALSAIWALAATLVTTTVLRMGRRGLTLRLLQVNLAVMACGALGMVSIMGGVDSPLAPATLIVAFMVPLVSPGRYAVALIGSIVLAIVIITLLQATGHLPFPMPTYFGGGGYAAPARTIWWRGLTLVWMNLGMLYVGGRVRAGFDRASERSLRARDEALADHEEQVRAMTTLAGEIAHELKNPLASVKGLAALVARQLSGQQAEQLAVLRREADRMQGILEEFLNFSRPLVPLQQEEVALEALARDVVELYAATAAERGVRLTVEPRVQVTARCDRRKVKQVLINLLQNAIDATPRGGSVRVVLGVAGDQVEIDVVDEGHGLDPTIAGREFDPGVTTKPRGSGLGLTVSRLLARQHGGELVLRSDGTGCTAALRWPRAGVDEAIP